MWLSMCMCSAFPAEKGEQMILTSFCDITIALAHASQGGYIRKVHKSLRAVVWVFLAEHSGNFQ